LQAYRVVDFAAPQAQPPQCLLDDAPVADHRGRAPVGISQMHVCRLLAHALGYLCPRLLG
jgi:hypothetical protein